MPIQIDYRSFYNDDYDFNATFFLNLKKTICWTEKIVNKIEENPIIDYSKILRSTNPIYEGRSFYHFEDFTYLLNGASTPALPFNYNIILTEALKVRQESVLPKENINNLGKILNFEIDLTTHDGAPCADSGFVDQSDIPPLETWFHITKKYLYCWIPAMFIDKMQSAIDIEIFGSYEWIDNTNTELNKEILETLQPGVV